MNRTADTVATLAAAGNASAAEPDILKFGSRSADKPPGRGAGERVQHAATYTELAALPHWRRVLSNFHVCPFRYEGKTYRTIEHGFQAAKIRLVSPATADDFALESGSELSRGDGLAARQARKLRVLGPADIARWNAMSVQVMARLVEAKYAQCREAQRVLLATGHAQLWHVAPRTKAVRFLHLERIRERLRRM